MTRKDELKARQFKRAMVLLKVDEGFTDLQIMAALNIGRPFIERLCKRFFTDGLEKALKEDPRPGQRRKMDEREEVVLIATACSDASEGYEHWTLSLLASKVVQLGVVETVSHETVRKTLKKTN